MWRLERAKGVGGLVKARETSKSFRPTDGPEGELGLAKSLEEIGS